jgi:LDH2 family malate/lactate/ureidoglycolate dehydrogenase
MADTIKIDPERLRAFGTAVYEAIGVSAERAALVADTLVQADLWGHQSHGVMRMPWYAARVRSGACNAQAEPTFEVDAGAIAVIDGHDGLGQAITAQAMREAIKRAKAHGMSGIAVRNSGHFGTAMYYTLMAAREGCIGFLTTNTSTAMAPWGGRRKGVGNNPWSWAGPGGSHPPLVLDIANTAVARGKVYLANKRNEPIPDTWALNDQGVPTTDPAEAVKGMIQPMGQHKGYAISVAMDMLAAVLSGSAFGSQIVGPMMPEGRSGAGHFLMVLNIAAFQPLESFCKRMDDYIAQLKATPLAANAAEILYPGELEARNDKKHRAEGVQIPADTANDLRELAKSLGLEARLPF